MPKAPDAGPDTQSLPNAAAGGTGDPQDFSRASQRSRAHTTSASTSPPGHQQLSGTDGVGSQIASGDPAKVPTHLRPLTK